MDPIIQILLSVVAVVATIAGCYFAAQKAMTVAVARLEAQYTALAKRVEATEHHGADIAVLRSQIADARNEISQLRDRKHDIGNLRAKVEGVISLFSRYVTFDRSLIEEVSQSRKS
jgi:chromosome segregation ATPase